MLRLCCRRSAPQADAALDAVGHSKGRQPMDDHTPMLPVKVFFSSPGDLFPERAIAKRFVTDELANYPHLKGAYAFVPYAYEDEVPPIVGEDPQPTVDKYLLVPQDADIVICLLWARMGTPTPSLINPETQAPYQSGTEYELLTAYHQRRPSGAPHIMLYHCMRPARFPD